MALRPLRAVHLPALQLLPRVQLLQLPGGEPQQQQVPAQQAWGQQQRRPPVGAAVLRRAASVELQQGQAPLLGVALRLQVAVRLLGQWRAGAQQARWPAAVLVRRERKRQRERHLAGPPAPAPQQRRVQRRVAGQQQHLLGAVLPRGVGPQAVAPLLQERR